MKAYDFRDDSSYEKWRQNHFLSDGNLGALLEPNNLVNVRNVDLKFKSKTKWTGATVELKSERYFTGNQCGHQLVSGKRRMVRTPNIYIERFSNAYHRTPGGPWQALKKKANYYVHFFLDGNSYWFDTVSIVKYVEEFIKNNNPREIKINSTTGYRIPIESLRYICINEYKIESASILDFFTNDKYKKYWGLK